MLFSVFYFAWRNKREYHLSAAINSSNVICFGLAQNVICFYLCIAYGYCLKSFSSIDIMICIKVSNSIV